MRRLLTPFLAAIAGGLVVAMLARPASAPATATDEPAEVLQARE